MIFGGRRKLKTLQMGIVAFIWAELKNDNSSKSSLTLIDSQQPQVFGSLKPER